MPAIQTLTSYLLDTLWSLTQCLSCFPSSPNLSINGTSYKILRLLGEGGFSYVYLVQPLNSTTLLALKKIRCPFGAESVRLALREVEAYALFRGSKYVITCSDHAVVSDTGAGGGGFGDAGGGEAKTVYILLPYYRRGNLQDGINANLVNGTRFPERRLMVLFRGVCRGLREMHKYKVRKGDRRKAKGVREESRQGLMEGAEGDEIALAADGKAEGEERSYAHRDIKPGNIMIADDGLTPILMDLGSVVPSPTRITSRAQALEVQDQAAEHSTMPYRAPELFDVKTDTDIDTAVDIWSLGCTLYACLVGKSPFEARSDETGGSLSLCVLGGDWRFPDEGPAEGEGSKRRGKMAVGNTPAAEGPKGQGGITPAVKDVVRRCLRVEPSERPDVDELLVLVDEVIKELPEDEGGFDEDG